MIAWTRSNSCSSCGKKPFHRIRKNIPGAVWMYFCDGCFSKFKINAS